MKTTTSYYMLLNLLFFFFIDSQATPIKNPDYLFDYRSQVDVLCIDYAPQSTTVHFKVRKDAGPQFRIGHGIYIVGDDGSRRHPIGSTGIELDSIYILYSGQRMNFSVSFETVGEDNRYLDVCMPGLFSLYGLHDKDIPADIPDVEPLNGDINPSLFINKEVIIEGRVHTSPNRMGSTIYANYITSIPGPFESADQYAEVGADGRFYMLFEMQAPQIFDFRQSRFYGQSYKQPLLACPGDHIFAEIYSKDSGIEVLYTKQSAGVSAERLANVPGLLSSYSEYVDNAVEGFKTLGYECQMADLAAGYEKELSFAKYVCWHYRLSPLESTLYMDRVHLYMILQMLTTDRLARQVYVGYPDKGKQYDNIADKRYYYLKNLPTDPYAFVWYPFFAAVCSELCALPEISQSINKSNDNMSGKMTDAFYKQKQVLASLTGTDDWSLYLDQILIDDIKRLSVQNTNMANEEITQLSSLLYHPYSKQRFHNLNR